MQLAALAGVVASAGMGAAPGEARAASSSPFACDQPDWAGGVALRISIPQGKAASIPVPRPCFGNAAITVAQPDSGRVDAGPDGAIPASAGFVRYTPAADTQGPVIVQFASSTGGTERVAVDVGGPDAARDVVAIGDSVTAAFGYCGTGDKCDPLDAPVSNSWMTLSKCNQEAEFPKAPEDLCSNNRRRGLPWNATSDRAGTIAYPYQFGSWLASASSAAQLPQPQVRNWAVSGARPAHWDPTPIPNDPTNKNTTPGAFSGKTAEIRDSLVVMTLGANKLLADFLQFDFSGPISWFADTTGPFANCTGSRGWFDGYDEASRERLRGCFDADWGINRQSEHLTSLYRTLLAQGNRVLVVGYHLACPTTFGTWQTMEFFGGPAAAKPCPAKRGDHGMSQWDQAAFVSGLLNDKIREAVQSTQQWARSTWPQSGRDAHIAFLDTASLDDWSIHQAWNREPWVFPNDTGIHPSRRGHAVMARNVADAACGLLGLYCAQRAAIAPDGYTFPGSSGSAAAAGDRTGSGVGRNVRASATIPATTVLARVGDAEITAGQVAAMAGALGADPSDPIGPQAEHALKLLVTGEQIRAEAKRLGIRAPRGKALARQVKALGGRDHSRYGAQYRYVAISAALGHRVGARLVARPAYPSAAAGRAYAHAHWRGTTVRPASRTVCLVFSKDRARSRAARRALAHGGASCARMERRYGRALAGHRPGLVPLTRGDLSTRVGALVFSTPVGSARQASFGTTHVAVRVQSARRAQRLPLRRSVVDAARDHVYDARVESARERVQALMERRWDAKTTCTPVVAGNPACTTPHDLWTW